MNLALDHFADDNPIIDELVIWPPRAQRIRSVRASNVLFRQPFIEVEMDDGEIFQRHFPRPEFSSYWAEACVILETLTDIQLVSEFRFEPVGNREQLVSRVLATRQACIEESNQMFAEGMYAQFLMQYGPDCKNLPPDALCKIAEAERQLGASA